MCSDDSRSQLISKGFHPTNEGRRQGVETRLVGRTWKVDTTACNEDYYEANSALIESEEEILNFILVRSLTILVVQE